jgi:hypothetical protein
VITEVHPCLDRAVEVPLAIDPLPMVIFTPNFSITWEAGGMNLELVVEPAETIFHVSASCKEFYDITNSSFTIVLEYKE